MPNNENLLRWTIMRHITIPNSLTSFLFVNLLMTKKEFTTVFFDLIFYFFWRKICGLMEKNTIGTIFVCIRKRNSTLSLTMWMKWSLIASIIVVHFMLLIYSHELTLFLWHSQQKRKWFMDVFFLTVFNFFFMKMNGSRHFVPTQFQCPKSILNNVW